MESVTGFSEPAAKGAMVRGTRPAETILLCSQLQSMCRSVGSVSCYSRGRRDGPLKAPVVAAVRVVRAGDGDGLVQCAFNLLGQGRQDLSALGLMEGCDPCRLVECWAELLGERAGGAGAHKGRQHALRGGRGLAEKGGTHQRGHCARSAGAMEDRDTGRQ
jgi:hypothetical protein